MNVIKKYNLSPYKIIAYSKTRNALSCKDFGLLILIDFPQT